MNNTSVVMRFFMRPFNLKSKNVSSRLGKNNYERTHEYKTIIKSANKMGIFVFNLPKIGAL